MAPICFKKLFHIIAYGSGRAVLPIVAVDHIIWAETFDHFIIHNVPLFDYLVYFRNRFYKLHSLFKRNCRKSLEFHHGFIRQDPYDDLAVFFCYVDNVHMSFMDHICCKACINCFHFVPPPSDILSHDPFL